MARIGPNLPRRRRCKMTSESTGVSGSVRPTLRLELFGGPALWRGQESVRISPLQGCLLAIVFTSGTKRVPRALVQSQLWEPGPDRVIRHRLSQLVYQLKQKCGVGLVELDGEYITVNRHEVSCDLYDLDRFMKSRQFKSANELLEQGFLSALTSRTTAALSDWLIDRKEEQRVRLSTEVRAFLDGLGPAYDGPVWHDARVLLSHLDPVAEDDARRVMRASNQGGQVREGQPGSGAFRERVATESRDWEPTPDTEELVHHRRTDAKQERNSRSDKEPPDPVGRSVGRNTEGLVLMQTVLRTTTEPGWKTIAVVGEEGFGKSHLVDSALMRARSNGHLVIEASATELESRILLNLLIEPLNKGWIEPFLREIPDPWKATLQALFPRFWEEGARPSYTHHLATDNLSRQTCEALLELFQAMARSANTVLFLDNFHWTDEATLTALEFLMRRWGKERFTLFVAYSPQEWRGRAFTRETDILSFDPRATVVELSPLDDESSRKLLELAPGRRLSKAATERIIDLAGGNPQFLTDLKATWPRQTAWPLYRERLTVPASVHRALERRMRGVSNDANTVASCLSVLGTPSNLAELVRLSDISRAKCVDALDELQTRGLVCWSDATVRFSCGIFGAAQYYKLSAPRRALLHTRVAELLHHASGCEHADRIALHYYWAGRHETAHEYAIEAVMRAAPADVDKQVLYLTLTYDTSTGMKRRAAALRLARLSHRCRRLDSALMYAKELLEEPEELPKAEVGELRLIFADARHRLGRTRTARTLAEFDAIEQMASETGLEQLRAAVMDATVQLLFRADDPEALLKHQARIGKLEPMSDPAARSRVSSALSAVASRGDPEAGVRLGRQAVEAARESALPDEIAIALLRLVGVLANAGRLGTEDGWSTLNEARRAHDEAGNTRELVPALLHLTDWQTMTADYETAEATLAEATTLLTHMDCPQTKALGAVVRGNLAIATGNLDAAHAALREGHVTVSGAAQEKLSAPPIANRIILALAGLEGNVFLELGKFGLANGTEQRAPLPETMEDLPLGLILFHARLASRRGKGQEALSILTRAIQDNDGKRPMVWLQLALEVVRLARRSGTPDPEMAVKAHATATNLGLAGIAHEFTPFCPHEDRPRKRDQPRG